MYDQNFRNQAVKECVNGQSMNGTARKYGISTTALRRWITEYQQKIAVMSGDDKDNIKEEAVQLNTVVEESVVRLMSVNVNIDGYDLTMSKQDVIKLMEIFYQFDK